MPPSKWDIPIIVCRIWVIFGNILAFGGPMGRPLVSGSTIALGRRFKVALGLQVGQHQPANVFGFGLRQEHLIEPLRLAVLLTFLLGQGKPQAVLTAHQPAALDRQAVVSEVEEAPK